MVHERSQIVADTDAERASIGSWTPGSTAPAFHPAEVQQLASRIRNPIHVLREGTRGRIGIGLGGEVQSGVPGAPRGGYPLLATLPALFPEWLGDRSFTAAHALRFPYVAGEMANGIATPAMVIAMARAGMLGFFGAAGLPIGAIERAVTAIGSTLDEQGLSWGSNLIHNLHDPAVEDAIVDLYLRHSVRKVSASAFMSLTPAVVRYTATGLYVDNQGRVQRGNQLFAKISRPEVAAHFLAPAPPAILDQLVREGKLTRVEADLAARVAVAEQITVEADSGGHTDNRPLGGLFPAILDLARTVADRHRITRPCHVGAAGGLGTPSAVAAAFALGAAYVLTGSINQVAQESGLSAEGKQLLAGAQIDDVAMAPAADMFELGVKVQVLKRGTLFSVRAHQLYDAYRRYGSLDALPADLRARLEREIFSAPLTQIWEETRSYFQHRDPAQLERAEHDPAHRMALVCRWYLGRASRWAIEGVAARRSDYQIWCGPAMGAFNAWTAGTFLEEQHNRTAVQIARNLLEGAAVITRAQQLRSAGVAVPPAAFHFRPRPLE